MQNGSLCVWHDSEKIHIENFDSPAVMHETVVVVWVVWMYPHDSVLGRTISMGLVRPPLAGAGPGGGVYLKTNYTRTCAPPPAARYSRERY